MKNNIMKNLNDKNAFVLFSWDRSQKQIIYHCISEYENSNNSEINFSERSGSIPDEKDTTAFDWFYCESFQNDGYLVNTKHYKTITDILLEECPVALFLAKRVNGEGTSRDILPLESGVYILFKR